MNRNQKIALGCGGGGCLGIILLVILGVVLVVTGVIKAPGLYNPDSDSNDNSNRNSNYNSPVNRNSNSNSTSNSNSSSSTTMSDEDKHKLFQAAAASQDADLMRRVSDKLGLLKSDGTPNDEYAPFFKDHLRWIFKNSDFMQTINTPEKARAYVNDHIDD